MSTDRMMDEMSERIEALSKVLLDDVLMAAPRLGDPVDSFVAAKAIGRINAVFARMFYDMSPGLMEQFLLMNETELKAAMEIESPMGGY